MALLDLASRLEDMLGAIRDIEEFAAGKTFDDYMAEAMRRRAIERSIEIVSEASRHIPDDLKAHHAEIPWRKVAGIGNVLRHGYKAVRDDELWNVVTTDLGPLNAAVEAMLREVEADGTE